MPPNRKGEPGAKRPKAPRKDYDELVAAAWNAGWECERTGKNYILCRSDKEVIRVPSTPSKQRTLVKLRQRFRRAGLDV